MSKKSFSTLLFASLLLLTTAACGNSDFLKIADFNQGNQNALGGYFNKFEQGMSKASVNLSDSVFRGSFGRSLKINAQKGDDGYCGAWMHLFDFRADNKEYFDATPYNYLSFWVRGKSGGESFTVKIADKRLIEIEDSAYVGKITKFLPNGVTQEWQEVLVPVNQLKKVDRSQLGGITFDFNSPGNHVVYIDDIVLKKSRDTRIEPTNSAMATNKADSAQRREIPARAMWVWTVFDLLKNENNEQATLFETCKRENIGRLWLQIPTQYEPGVDLSADVKNIQPPEFKILLRHEDKLRAFIKEAHARNIKVEGLDGYPEFAQKPYHFIPLAIVDAVIDYNQRVEPEERFDGIHFDNEPYLLIGWHNKSRREEILREFLTLNVECQRRIRENSNMVYGVDVPFWWNAADPTDEGAIGDVTFNGERKPAVYFCIDLLDNVGIMNYRDTTYGVDGIVAHAAPILNYAEKAGKDQVYVGLEVFRYRHTEVVFPLGLPRQAFHEAIQSNKSKFGYLSRINGFRTQIIDDGLNLHVGIELPLNPDEDMQKKIDETIIEMAHHLGITSAEGLSPKDQKKAVMYVQNEINRNPEWKDYEFMNIKDPQMLQEYPVFETVRIMLGKTTFADESYEEFKSQLKSAERELINYPAYAGIAIHYFKVLNDKFYENQSQADTSTASN